MKKYLLIVGIIVGIIVGLMAGIYLTYQNKAALGSVTTGNEYMGTTTRQFNGTALSNASVLRTGTGSLGSVVITGAATGVINLYDATSTVTNTQYGTTTLATFPASVATGTYTFDVTYSRGLVYEVIGTAPTSTITFK